MFLRSHDRHSEMPALGQEPKLILYWLARTVLNGFGFSAGLLHCNWESYTWLTSMILFVNFPRFLSFFLPNELKKFLHQATIHNVLTVVAAQSVQLWQSRLVHAIVEGTDKWPLLLWVKTSWRDFVEVLSLFLNFLSTLLTGDVLRLNCDILKKKIPKLTINGSYLQVCIVYIWFKRFSSVVGPSSLQNVRKCYDFSLVLGVKLNSFHI